MFFQKKVLFVFLALYLDKKIFFSTFANVREGHIPLLEKKRSLTTKDYIL